MREGPGDMLVFLSGEREIRDTADALGRLDLPGVELLPLYARLSAAEQHRVFAPHPGRRIVLATNVAETSLTVPGIVGVVDPGTARISRYNRRTKVQRLPDRGDLAGVGRPAGRPLRARRAGHLHPPLLRGGLRRPPGVHRAGDPAHEPGVGHPPDGRARPRRHRRVPVRRAARRAAASRTASCCSRSSAPSSAASRRRPRAAHQARPPPGPHPGRPAAGPHGPRGRPPRRGGRGARARGGALDPGPARAADRRGGGGRRAPPPLRRPRLRLPRLPQPVALPAGAAEGARARARSGGCAGASTSTTSASGSGRTSTASSARSPSASASRSRRWPTSPTAPAIHRALLVGPPVAGRDARSRRQRVPRRPRGPVRAGAGHRARAPPAQVGHGGRAGGDQPPAGAHRRPDRAGRHRAGGRPPRHPQLRGPVVGRGTRRGDDHRAGEPLRAPGRHRAAACRSTRSTRREPGRCSCATRSVDGDWDGERHAFVRANQEQVADVVALEERVRRDLLVGDDDLVAFFDARVPDDVTSARRFDTWWAKAQRDRARPAHLPAGRPHRARRRRPRPGRLPRGVAARRGPAPAHLRARPDVGPRRRGGRRAAARSSTRSERAGLEWQVPGRRLDLVTALVRTLPKDLRRRHTPARRGRRRGARRASGPTTARCSTCSPARSPSGAGPPVAAAPPRPGVGARPPPRHLPRRRRRRPPAGVEQGPAGPAAPAGRAGAGGAGRRRHRSPRCTAPRPGRSARSRRPSPSPTPGTPSPGIPRSSTRATRSACGCCPPSPRRGPRCGAAPDGCSSCSSARRCARSTGRCPTPRSSRSPRPTGCRRPRPTATCAAAAVDQLLVEHGGPVRDAEPRSTALGAAVRAGLRPSRGRPRRRSWPTPSRRATSIDAALGDHAHARPRRDGARRPRPPRPPAPPRLDRRRRLRPAPRRGALPAGPRAPRAEGPHRTRPRPPPHRRHPGSSSASTARVAARDATGEVRTMLEELRVSTFAQSVGAKGGVSEPKVRQALARWPEIPTSVQPQRPHAVRTCTDVVSGVGRRW